MGGEYVEGNVIPVEVTQCDMNTANHVMWHFANWCLYGKEEDKLAYRGLSGYYGKEELIEARLNLGRSKNGKRAMSPGGWLYENRVEYGHLGYKAGIGKSENRLTREQQSELAKRIWEEGKGLASLTTEQRKEIGRRGGKATGRLHRERGTGICGIPAEERSKRMSETNCQKWQCPMCDKISNARWMNEHMLKEHNLPGDAKVKICNKEGEG
jgi:general stress protein YciG